MKQIILTAIVVGGLVATFFLVTQKTPAPSSPSAKVENGATPTSEMVEPPKKIAARRILPRAVSGDASEPAVAVQNEAPTLSPEEILFQQTIEKIISSQATFSEKEAIWKQLKEEGKLDQAIAELENRASSNLNADTSATLGIAYIKKLQGSEDQRDQAMLAMKADKTFDSALKIDPANWDAQYFKTASMTYWPEQMNKGPEIVQRFTDLIKQQEAMPSQPQFARPYYLLGEQYQKSGHPEEAKQVWQRGLSLFPENQTLQKKLAATP